MNLVQKLFFVCCLITCSLMGLYGEDPSYGELKIQPAPPLQNTPPPSVFIYQFIPKVTYYYENPPPAPHDADLDEEVEVLWLFSDGNYITESEMNSGNGYQFRNENPMDMSLHANARYVPTDPIRYNIAPIHNSGDTYRILNNGKDIEIFKSWNPVSDDTDSIDYVFYIITVENHESMKCNDSVNGILKIDYPSDKITITQSHVIIDEGFEFHDSTVSSILYRFYNLNQGGQYQRNLVIKAEVKDNLAENLTFQVNAEMLAGSNMNPKSFNIADSSSIECFYIENETILNTVTKPPKDPNGKIVNRDTICINEKNVTLEYTIDFENIEGSDASKVVIKDYYNAEHLGNYEFIETSHLEELNRGETEGTETEDGRFVFKFIFDDGNSSGGGLPATSRVINTEDEGRSKGYIKYRMTVKEPYEIGTEIGERAEISFYWLDGNIPVETIPTDPPPSTKILDCKKKPNPDPKEDDKDDDDKDDDDKNDDDKNDDDENDDDDKNIVIMISISLMVILSYAFIKKNKD